VLTTIIGRGGIVMGKGYSRNKPYVEDSTKGAALLNNPKRYKGDVMVQVWMDSRVLATISRWLDQEGMFTRFMSEVVRDSLKLFCDFLVDTREVDMTEDTKEARDLLVRKYRVNLNVDGRGLKNAVHNQLLSDRKNVLSRHTRVRAGQIVGSEEVVVHDEIPSQEQIDADFDALQRKKMIDEAKGREEKILAEMFPKDKEKPPIVNEQPAESSVCEIVKSASISKMRADIIADIQRTTDARNGTLVPDNRYMTPEEVTAKNKEIAERDKEQVKAMDDMGDVPPGVVN
jgi:hypothetical protein